MISPGLRRLLAPLRRTPLHPQWLVLKDSDRIKKAIAAQIQGRLLDVGCGNQPLQRWLGRTVDYFGLDYPTTVAKGYTGKADVFGDAQQLPFEDNCFDVVTVLHVMEHLPWPEAAFTEMLRVTRPGGLLITQTPFLYPLHDLPDDFQRWTSAGLQAFERRHPVELIELQHHGRPPETGAALSNLALAKGLLACLEQRHLGILLTPLIVLAIPLINLVGWLQARLLPSDTFMPMGYTAIYKKLE